MKRAPVATIRLTPRQLEHVIAALAYLDADWSSPSAYEAVRQHVRSATGPYMTNGELEKLIAELMAQREAQPISKGKPQ